MSIQAKDVIEWFHQYGNNPTPMQIKVLDKGWNVSTKVRKDILTSDGQGKVIVNGRVRDLQFRNLGGGVWNVTLGE